MKWTIKLVVEVVPGSPVEHEVGSIERAEEISPATVGLTIAEGKALLASLQSQIVTEQIQRYVASVKACPECGKAFRTKGYYRSTLRSVYGKVGMRIRRLRKCPCSGLDAESFSTLFTNKSPITPELRYLTAKMAALLPFRKVTDFLGELLPLSAQATASTVRNRTMISDAASQKTPHSVFDPGADAKNEWLERATATQQNFMSQQRGGSAIEENARALGSRPAKNIEPAGQAEPHSRFCNIAVAEADLNAGGMVPSFFTVSGKGINRRLKLVFR